MNFPFYIAKRYLIAKSDQNAVNIINFVTFLVIVIGAAALFIVLSAFAGLKTFSLSFSNTFDPDLKAIPATGKYFSLSPGEEEALQKVVGLANYSKELEEKAYITFKEKSCIASIKGVDENYREVTGVDSTLYFGYWGIPENNGVIGMGIYNQLSVSVGNSQTPITVLVPKPGKGSLLQSGLQSKPYNELSLGVSGVYAVEENLDKKYVFAPLYRVQALLNKNDTQVSGINFRLDGEGVLTEVKNAITTVLGDKVLLLNRQELNRTLYRMLNTENVATYLIFTLVLIIALFNVVGALIMMILDKRQNSKTLFCLGATLQELRHIYFIQGLLVTSLGGCIGVLLGSVLIVSQQLLGWLKITSSLAYPVEYKGINVLIVVGTIVVWGGIASKMASSRVSKKLIST